MNNSKKEGTLYWITGLSGAGKSTIGKLLYERIHVLKDNVFLLDGDVGRWAYNDTVGYTKAERKIGAYRNSRVCKMICSQGIDVICCTVSMFDEVRAWNRKNFTKYWEIFLDVPMDVLIARDQKGLYSSVRRGENKDVVGLDQESEFPKNPHVCIVNDGTLTPTEVLDEILEYVVVG